LTESSSTSAISYRAVNIIFIGVIGFIFSYSVMFHGDNHPIPSLFKEVLGLNPISKGLSASFSEIVRGNLQRAIEYNPYSVRIFAFFALQLLLRIFFSIVVKLKGNRIFPIVITDAAISTLLFFWCFAPLIGYTLDLFLNLIKNIL
jgi:hypothetical protein